MTPRWMSQVVPPMGAIKAEGIRNQLGRPEIDRLTVLVREAAQNSWDARDGGSGPVGFALDLRTFDEAMARAWQSALSPEIPTTTDLPLRAVLAEGGLDVLFVSDRGTSGLGGPTRAGVAVGHEPHDYLSFVLNVGEPRDTPEGGGTYGFGKAAYYLSSHAAAILVYTRARLADGAVESRLIGIALGDSYERDGLAYTGRHWFGLASADEVEPVRGEQADELAARLGFPEIGDGETGTTVAVIGFDLDGRDPADVGAWLANAITWHLWPKMVDHGDGPAMEFRVTVDGSPVAIAGPGDHPIVREFAASAEGPGTTITYGRRRTQVGSLSLRTVFAPLPEVDTVGAEAGVGAGVHHVCLLRAPELVVEYRAGPSMPDSSVWYVGTFKVFEELDEMFAAAEPPTHDSWSPAQLPDRERSIVTTTLRKVDQALQDHARPRPADVVGGTAEGLSGISRMLGGLLASAPAAGAGPSRGSGGGGSGRSAVRTFGAPRWVDHRGELVLAQSFETTGGRTIHVEADVGVRLWGGGSESEVPHGASVAAVLGWRGPDGRVRDVEDGSSLTVAAQEAGPWELLVRAPVDAATTIRVREARPSADA